MEPGSISATPTYSEGEGTFSGKLDLVSYNARSEGSADGRNHDNNRRRH